MHIQKTYFWQNSFNLPLNVNIIQVETISFWGNLFCRPWYTGESNMKLIFAMLSFVPSGFIVFFYKNFILPELSLIIKWLT